MSNIPAKIKWHAPEHEYHEKGPEWFWVLGIITLAMILAAVILKNFLFAILVVLSGFCVALYGARRPRMAEFELTPRGIMAWDKLHDYDSISHFWIEYDPPHKKELILELKKKMSPHMVIMLGDADPEIVREYLIRYLREKKITESFAASMARLLKF